MTKNNYNEIRGNKIKEMLIYLTSQCQLRCKHCYVPNEEKIKQLTLEDINWLLKNFEVKNVNLLGGEPLLHPNIIEIIQKFEKVTISTNGIILSLDSSHSNELIETFKAKDKNLSVQLSIQGNKKDTDEIRGAGVWEKVMLAAQKLKQNKIPCYFVATYSDENVSHFEKVIDEVTHPLHIPLVLFPEIGKPPLSPHDQIRLFSMILEKNKKYNSNNLIDQPNFFQWLGLPGRCGAASERLSLNYNKEFTPCHLDFDYVLGKIGTPVSIINKNRELFVKSQKQIQSDCLFCDKAGICKSGCYMSGSSQGCPLKVNYTVDHYAFNSKTNSSVISEQISNMKGLLHGSIICG